MRVWRDPVRNKCLCVCGGAWPCQRVMEPCNQAIEAAHLWKAGDGPIPDGTDGPPLDFVQTAQGLYRLARADRGETWRPV